MASLLLKCEDTQVLSAALQALCQFVTGGAASSQYSKNGVLWTFEAAAECASRAGPASDAVITFLTDFLIEECKSLLFCVWLSSSISSLYQPTPR